MLGLEWMTILQLLLHTPGYSPHTPLHCVCLKVPWMLGVARTGSVMTFICFSCSLHDWISTFKQCFSSTSFWQKPHRKSVVSGCPNLKLVSNLYVLSQFLQEIFSMWVFRCLSKYFLLLNLLSHWLQGNFLSLWCTFLTWVYLVFQLENFLSQSSHG